MDKQESKRTWDAIRKDVLSGRLVMVPEGLASEVSDDLPTTPPTGRILPMNLWSQRSQELLYIRARYGSATAETAELTLSAYTEMANRTQSIVERQRSAMSFWRALANTSLTARDQLMFGLALMNHAGGQRIVWEAEQLPGGIIRVRSRFNR